MMHSGMFKAGDAIGPYSIQRLIGVGFMGEVYHAVHGETGEAVALKCLQVRHLENADLVERARREAVALSQIRHANIVYVHDAGVTGSGVIWMAMELLVGRSLRAVMKQHSRMPVPLALHYICEIADGVDAAHEFSIVHRDLKPENVFVTETNQVRVLDLGTAKFFGHEMDTTGRAQVFGTVPYMSPEHLAGERVDARTDVYALGMVLYEMLAGEHPFKAQFESILELGRAQMFQMPKPLYDVVPGLPVYLWSLVEKAIAKDREHRHMSMSDFARAIRSARRRYEADFPESKSARPLLETPAHQVPSGRRDYVAPQPASRPMSGAEAPHGPRVAVGGSASFPPPEPAKGAAPPGVYVLPPPPQASRFTPLAQTIRMEHGVELPQGASSAGAPGGGAQKPIGPYGTQIIPPDVRAAMVAKALAAAGQQPPSGVAQGHGESRPPVWSPAPEVRTPYAAAPTPPVAGEALARSHAPLQHPLPDPGVQTGDALSMPGRASAISVPGQGSARTGRGRSPMPAVLLMVAAGLLFVLTGVGWVRWKRGASAQPVAPAAQATSVERAEPLPTPPLSAPQALPVETGAAPQEAAPAPATSVATPTVEEVPAPEAPTAAAPAGPPSTRNGSSVSVPSSRKPPATAKPSTTAKPGATSPPAKTPPKKSNDLLFDF